MTTNYGKKIKHRLVDLDWTMRDLAKEVHDMTGLYTDSALMTKVCTGQCSSTNVIEAINVILGI